MSNQHAAVAAIQFSLNADDGLTFLRLWNQGDFDKIRREWPEAPEAVYVGADQLHPDTLALDDGKDATDQDAMLLNFTEEPGVMIDGSTDAETGEPAWYVNGKTYPSGVSLRQCLADAIQAKATLSA